MRLLTTIAAFAALRAILFFAVGHDNFAVGHDNPAPPEATPATVASPPPGPEAASPVTAPPAASMPAPSVPAAIQLGPPGAMTTGDITSSYARTAQAGQPLDQGAQGTVANLPASAPEATRIPELEKAVVTALDHGRTVSWRSETDRLSGYVVVSGEQADDDRICRNFRYSFIKDNKTVAIKEGTACKSGPSAWTSK